MSSTSYHMLSITSVQELTAESICVSFSIPEALKTTFAFIPGQYLTIRCEIDGEKVSRSYSICSGIQDDTLRVAIKCVKDGLFSNHANDNFSVGDSIEVMAPQGNFTVDLDPTHQKNTMCIAAGSGITPILSIIKSVLTEQPESQITLIYGNRDSASMMFREELSFLKNRFLTRFKWINVMSKEDQGSDLFKGHIDNKKGYLLNKTKMIDIRSTDDVFICGPQSMMSEVSRGFRAEGVPESNIHYELFANSAEDAKLALEKAKLRVERFGEEKTSTITVIADNRSVEFELASSGENILDAGIHRGMELPHSCKAGVCSTCKAKLVSGQVEMDITHALEAHEIDDGMILTCQAHPVSDQVVIDFDQR